MKRRRKPNKIKKYGEGVYGVQEMEVPETMSGMDVAKGTGAGALQGAKAGSQIGGMIPGVGHAAGAIGGTVIGGALAYTQARDAQQDSRIVKGNIESFNRFAEGMEDRGLRNQYMTMAQAKHGLNMEGLKPGEQYIEIEGKKAPEIHTDANYNIKSLGTVPHAEGGTVVAAKPGDIVFDTQNSPKDFQLALADIKKYQLTGDKKAKARLDKRKAALPKDTETGTAEDGLNLGEFDSPRLPYSDNAFYTPNRAEYATKSHYTPPIKKDYSPDKVIDYSYGDNLGLEGIPESHYNKPSASQIASKEYKSPFKYSSQEEFSNFIDNTGYQTTSSEGTPIETNRKNIPNKFISQEPINKVQPGALGTPVADAGYGMKEPELTEDLIGESAFKVTPSNKEFLSHYDPKKSITEKATEKKLPFSEADFGQEMKRANNPLKYANVLHNLMRGAEEADTMTPRRFNPELMKYKDMSAGDRAATLQAASLQNYQNRGKGLTAGQRQSMAGQTATRASKIISKLNETERARQKAVQDANVGILNQAKLQNLKLAMGKEDYDKKALAAKDAYTDAAWKETAEKAQYAELGENKFRYDKNRSNMDKWAMQHLLDTGQMTFDAKGNIVFKGTGTNKTTA